MTFLSAFNFGGNDCNFLCEDEVYKGEFYKDDVSFKWLGRSCGARLRDATRDKTPVNRQGLVMYEGNVFADAVLPPKMHRQTISTKNGDLTLFIDQKVVA